jgi:integrase
VQSSTLVDNLRVLRRVYEWAATVGGFELDDFPTSGQRLDARQIESLAAYLRMANRALTACGATCDSELRNEMGTIDAGTFDHQLSVAENFLKWSLDSANRGGVSALSIAQLGSERSHLELLFKSLRIGARPAERREPLEEPEIAAIRIAIGPRRSSHSEWVFSDNVFAKQTRLRNWLMFETALNLGLRRGELLKLRLDCLPRGSDDGIRVLRLPDDPGDSRTREPAVKTAERVIPAPRQLLAAFRAYLTLPLPLGRAAGMSPYLFVTGSGNPVSLDTADDIITAIGRYSGVAHLSWHRLRHTWAERMADLLADQTNGIDKLIYLGGWTDPASARHYIQRAIAKQARESFRSYHDRLYGEAK